MASKRKINQDDLRKMMAQVKTGTKSSSGGGPPISKRYKLSSRELSLMEEQKRQQDERKKLKEAQNKASLSKLPPAPPPEAKPQKSILKNTATYQPTIIIPSNITLSSANNHDSNQTSTKSERGMQPPGNESSTVSANISKSNSTSNSTKDPNSDNSATRSEHEGITEGTSIETSSSAEHQEGQSAIDMDTNIPEGFFDDPIQDAKARHVPYVNVEEEEWERFQKEIGEEMSTAQSILVEDREEATADRQIEEIDEQMEAWRRVSVMEKRKDQVQLQKGTISQNKQQQQKNKTEEDSDSNDEIDSFEEFLSWRKKH